MKKIIATLVTVAGVAGIAQAQPYETGATLAFQAWNGSAWVDNITVTPGARVEIRAVVNYTGTAPAVALGSLRYQPTVINADLTGASQDDFAPWRNGGVSGDLIANSMLSLAEGNDGAALASYGRVGFGSTAMQSSSLNVMTTFKHGGDFPANGLPATGFGSSALRVAGSFVSAFPGTLESGATANDINSINRGVVATQSGEQIAGTPNPNYRAGTSNLVIFRAALLMGDGGETRTVTSDDRFLARAGSVNSTDNRRFALFQNSASDVPGTIRVDVDYLPLTIQVPTPASMALLGLGGLAAARRRRA